MKVLSIWKLFTLKSPHNYIEFTAQDIAQLTRVEISFGWYDAVF